MANLYIDDLYSNPDSRIQIIGTEFDLNAFVVDDTFKISMSANYESKYDRLINDMLGKIPGVSGGVDIAKDFFGVQVKSLESTRMTWVDSEKPKFSMQIEIPAIRPNQEAETLEAVKNFGGGILPKSNDLITVKPPLDFKVQDRATGRFTVLIGRWFRAPFQILTSIDFDIAKEKTPRGYPIHTRGTLSFEPDRMVTQDEFKGYFLL